MIAVVLTICLATGANDADSRARLEDATAFVEDLEYEAAIPLLKRVLEDTPTTSELRLEAYRLLGSCYAVLGRAADAEQAFRFLLRGSPDYDMDPGETPPKILRVFRNVKVEEDRIRAETAQLERQRVIRTLTLNGGPPAQVKGGQPLVLEYELTDPGKKVATVSVGYRRGIEGEFSMLALEPRPPRAWAGTIPGEWTASDGGFELQYFLTTADVGGKTLLEVGAPPGSPLSVRVAPGEVVDTRPLYRRGWFWAAIGAVVVGAGVTAGVLYATRTELPGGPRVDL